MDYRFPAMGNPRDSARECTPQQTRLGSCHDGWAPATFAHLTVDPNSLAQLTVAPTTIFNHTEQQLALSHYTLV